MPGKRIAVIAKFIPGRLINLGEAMTDADAPVIVGASVLAVFG